MAAQNIGGVNWMLGMGYDPSGLKLFKSDLADARRASEDMIEGMSRSAGRLDPMMARLNEHYREQARLAAEATRKADAANIAALAKKHDALNAGPSGTQDFAKLEASLRQQSDREYWAQRARLRDQNLKDEVQAEKIVAIQIRQEKLATHKAEADALRWQMLTEKEKFAARKKADLEHLQMLQQAGVLTKTELAAMSKQAGTLGLGNVPGAGSSAGPGMNYGLLASQIGFGLQDFTSQLANSKNMVDGLGRGIMAVSNNIQMLGAAWGPTGLAVTAIGGSVAGIVLPAAIKWLTNTEEVEKATQKLVTHYERMAERVEAVTRIQVSSPDAALEEIRNLERKAMLAEQESVAETRRTAQRRAELDKLKAEEKADDDKFRGRTRKTPELMAYFERQEQRSDRIKDLSAELETSDKRVNEKARAAQDAQAELMAVQGDREIAERRQVELEIQKLTREQTAEQLIANQKRLEDKRDMFNAEIKLYERAGQNESEASRKARELRLSELKRDAELNAEVLATITPKANAAAAGERLRLDREATDRKLSEAEKLAKQIGQDARERFTPLGFADRELARDEPKRERDAVVARQEREMRDLRRKTALMPGQEDVLALQASKNAAEMARLEIKHKEDELSRISQINRGAAGVDANSSEGVAAINRALAGSRSDLDINKQQLEELKKIARAAEDDVRRSSQKVVALSGA